MVHCFYIPRRVTHHNNTLLDIKSSALTHKKWSALLIKIISIYSYITTTKYIHIMIIYILRYNIYLYQYIFQQNCFYKC